MIFCLGQLALQAFMSTRPITRGNVIRMSVEQRRLIDQTKRMKATVGFSFDLQEWLTKVKPVHSFVSRAVDGRTDSLWLHVNNVTMKHQSWNFSSHFDLDQDGNALCLHRWKVAQTATI